MVADLVKHGEDFPNEDMLAYYIPYSMNSTAASVGTYLYLFNTDGQCILCSANTGQEADGLTLSVEMLHAMKEKGTYLTDRSSGKFNRSIAEPMLCNGSAFTIQQDGREQTYYLFANTYTHALNNYVTDFILVTVLVSLAVLAIAIAMEMHIILQRAKQRSRSFRFCSSMQEAITRRSFSRNSGWAPRWNRWSPCWTLWCVRQNVQNPTASSLFQRIP